MLDSILFNKVYYHVGCELWSSISNYFSWYSKEAEDFLKEKVCYNLFSSPMQCFGFYPFRDVVCAYQDVEFML